MFFAERFDGCRPKAIASPMCGIAHRCFILSAFFGAAAVPIAAVRPKNSLSGKLVRAKAHRAGCLGLFFSLNVASTAPIAAVRLFFGAKASALLCLFFPQSRQNE
ncbi:hypothetical protein BC351_10860 [Paenibacillus ferrarius]|uniref:Uncharacterized protein n=1 Tax=Paenibacillus ferrarius TaxID=1469647 RepID=A0A1V4H953_9BACL|nr:hypothetical protein BC351_10860 [Paenibacillus ferrarius]